jgi:hypothetical protein
MAPIQRFLWRHLKKNSVFKLIGTPVTEGFIMERFGKTQKDELIINGDYKASTDNLHSWISDRLSGKIVDRLNENGVALGGDYHHLDERFKSLLRRSLTGHVFLFPDGRKEVQKEGQLMGSVTSFPFLCMANAAMCRWAVELSDHRPYRLRDRPFRGHPLARLIVNGDDCTLKGSRSGGLRSIWGQITSYGGLESSLGKTIFSLEHRPIIVINSQTFDWNDELRVWVCRRYVNMGIMMGKPRSVLAGCQIDAVPYERLGSQHRELYESCPPDVWSEVSSRFIHYNRNELSKYPDIPWSIPEYLGGPGLVPKDGEISLYDRTVASLIIATGEIKKIRKACTQPEWQLHQLVKKRFGSASVNEQRHTSIRRIVDLEADIFADNFLMEDCAHNEALLYKLFTVETLKANSLKQVYCPAEPQGRKTKKSNTFSSHKNLMHNNRLWAKASSRISEHWSGSIVVRSTEELMYEKKSTFIPTLRVY